MRFVFLLLPALLIGSVAHAAGVVVSIKPLHSLVAGVMAGTGEAPSVLVSGQGSLHQFSLKPSQAAALQQADLVFYFDPQFETFLARPLAALPPKATKVALSGSEGVALYPLRLAAGFDAHEHGQEHGHAHHDDHDSATDFHLWLDARNASAMVDAIAAALSRTYPQHAPKYAANATLLKKRLTVLHASLAKRMAPLSGRPFVVFHDAYQYFEKAYGLTSLGAITLNPEQGLKAGRVSEIRGRVVRERAVCVFHEPQFDHKVVDTILEGTGTKSASLDPEAAQLEAGAELYFELMERLAGEMEACLKP